MYEVGPYSTGEKSHMERLGPLVLTLSLRVDHDREQQKKQKQESLDLESSF